ncbi:Rieske 2Fe-2S domain-containing protein [Aquabacterium sp. A7-Y]|uniref:Rieske (2Fe-2S) protein n=1 Tax=Aquabacterium sp. A7-Y TaxID=1349605 RepID=UPI00223D24E4|nr:Rieske 2Fe-2S domain-containing protein [Aquabacterium sp. A7-Y]MCW7541703.1 Rieske 2Fe-2S domain-containing protein [Aquabacterium sp. A7-Y]
MTPELKGVELCESAALQERGLAVSFDVLLWGGAARAFALRFDGRPVSYVNRCAHVPTEMDWQPDHFLDDSGEWIICSIHGAIYNPRDGRCAGGPCPGAKLIEVKVDERDGKVYWYPSADVQPVFQD